MANPTLDILTSADAEVWLDGTQMLNTMTRVAKRGPYRIARFNFVGNLGTHKARVITDEGIDIDAVYQRDNDGLRKLQDLATAPPEVRKSDIPAVFGYPDVQVGGYAETACYVLSNPSRDIMFDDIHRGTWGFEGAGFFSDGNVVAPSMAAGDHPLTETTAAKFLSTSITAAGNTDSALSTFDKTNGQTMMVARILSRTGTSATPPTVTIAWNGVASDGFVRVTHGAETLAFPVRSSSPINDVYQGFRSLAFSDGFRVNPTINRHAGTGVIQSVTLTANFAGDTESFTIASTSVAPFNTGQTYTGTGDRLEAQLFTAPATGPQRATTGPVFHIDSDNPPPFNVFIPVSSDVVRAGLRFISPAAANITVRHSLAAI